MAKWDGIGDMYSTTPLAERQAFAASMANYEEEEPLPRKGKKELEAEVARLRAENRQLRARLNGTLKALRLVP